VNGRRIVQKEAGDDIGLALFQDEADTFDAGQMSVSDLCSSLSVL